MVKTDKAFPMPGICMYDACGLPLLSGLLTQALETAESMVNSRSKQDGELTVWMTEKELKSLGVPYKVMNKGYDEHNIFNGRKVIVTNREDGKINIRCADDLILVLKNYQLLNVAHA